MDLEDITQYIFACYDFKNDEIRYCKKGSWAWWHEKGHSVQYKNNGLIRQIIDLWSTFLCMTVMGLVLKSEIITWFFFILFIYAWQYPELDAWIYAFKNHGKAVN
jgi:hypothetical protein